MARILVAAVVLQGLGGLAQDCSPSYEVKDDGVHIIKKNIRQPNQKLLPIVLHTRQEAGFEGVTVTVHGDGGDDGGGHNQSVGLGHNNTAWFNPSCFGRDGRWGKMKVGVSGNESVHVIEVQTAGCGRRCLMHGLSGQASSFSVAAHGPSRWRYLIEDPEGTCLDNTTYAPEDNSWPPPTCVAEPPAKEQGTDEKEDKEEEEAEEGELSQVVVVAVVVAVLLLLLLLGLGVFYCRRRRRGATRQIHLPTQPEEVDLRPPPAVRAIHTYVDEESPYESLHLDDYYTAATPQDEPLGGPKAPAATVTPQDEPPGGSEEPAAATAGLQDKPLGEPEAPAAAAPAVVSVESLYATVARKR